MKLIDFAVKEDFGRDFYFFFLKTKKYTLIQGSLGWYDYPSWPYIQINMGMGRLFSVLLQVYKFGFDMEFCGRTFNLNYLDEDASN
jgi:hypothetical protein